jgi:hypothetical protein
MILERDQAPLHSLDMKERSNPLIPKEAIAVKTIRAW